SLPQILAKSGAKYFYTNKMSWNATTQFPFIVFYWQAPDGSKVLTYSMPYSLNLLLSKPGMREFKEYTSFLENIEKQRVFNYETDYDEIKKRRTLQYIHDLAFIYGMGDGGGGPLRAEIIYLKEFMRLKQIKGFITMLDYFKLLEKFKDRLPIWNDELYLEIHRGTYTSQVWLKQLNRKTEFDLYNLEVLSSLSALMGWSYPAEKIKKIWKVLLFNQFHDILPGSAIPAVYDDTRKDFEKIHHAITQIKQSAFDVLLKKINIPQDGILVFNTHSWKRDALIELESIDKSLIKDRNGAEVSSQLTANKQIFIAKDIPSIGYTFFSLSSTKNLPSYTTDINTQDEADSIVLENTFLKVQINKTTGYVSSIYHKTLGKEILTAPGNRVQIFNEKMLFMNPAWNINPNYKKTPLKLNQQLSVELKESGPVRATVEIIRQSTKPSTQIVQKVSLLTQTDRVDFKLYLKYYIKSTIVKLAFPFNVESDKIHCEIPFGVISRSTKPKTPAQKAQWEISAHKWVDVSQNDFGVTLINKSRYGFDAHYHPNYKSVVRMTIFRIPPYPRAGNPIGSIIPTRKWHEQSEYSVEYSLYIHKGDWCNSNCYLLANEFNNPPIQIPVEKNAGVLSEELEFVTIDPANVLLSAFKIPEDQQKNSLILRVYEMTGKQTNAKIRFSESISIENAFETDLLELNPQKCDFRKNSLEFSIKPFEIKTFLIKYDISW
ncbi:MAG TPA: glycoside hydrolase family 38 C-terminal domain-containing protein, partial [Candidatus Deferrimicrobium sp.]|nr:glycoside hydrolase family 38 C-terminal domain-containing protein [Candidatus Deferrimicrobium sp.]